MKSIAMPLKKLVFLPLFPALLLVGPAFAAEPQTLNDCAQIADNEKRLVCYDLIAGRTTPFQPGQMDRAGEAFATVPALPSSVDTVTAQPDRQEQQHWTGAASSTATAGVAGSSISTTANAAAKAAASAAAADGSRNQAANDTNAVSASASASALPDTQPETIDLPATLSMTQHWELGAAGNRGTFNFRPHRSNYLLLKHSDSPNAAPYRQFVSIAPEAANVSHTELAFQLGFKTKLVEDVMQRPVDLWFGYTQQSFWQIANRRASSPFRETNFQPELMAVAPLNFRLLGMDARFLNLGFVHQSNGQAASLSRSWNRVYAQLGFERGDFGLLTRVWKRIEEDRSEDDNPDITDYMGHGDIQATYRWQGHELSALARYNLHSGHGAAELGWAFPLSAGLKGYVQYFSGYGQSLIDYDHDQQSLGVGVMLNY